MSRPELQTTIPTLAAWELWKLAELYMDTHQWGRLQLVDDELRERGV